MNLYENQVAWRIYPPMFPRRRPKKNKEDDIDDG